MPREKYLKGADKVRRIFGALASEMADEITVALNRGGEDLTKGMEILVPRDQGDLAADIHKEIEVTPRGVALRVYAGTTAETAIAARVQENGRAPSPDGHPGHAKQPFFFLVWHARRKKVVGRVKRAMNKAAKTLVRKHG